MHSATLSEAVTTPIPLAGGCAPNERQPEEVVTQAAVSQGYLSLHFVSQGKPSVSTFELTPEWIGSVEKTLRGMKGKPFAEVMKMELSQN